MPAPTFSAVSLYSGAGGLDLGFSRAGFAVEWAVDLDPLAVATYREHLGDHIVCGALPQVSPPQCLQPDVVIGGPPCQGFSVAGRMDPADRRSEHVFHFLDVVERLRPSAFVLENVKALARSPRWSPIREALLRRARDGLGYATELFLLNAAHFGVPQARERMFLIGVLAGRPERPRAVTADTPPTVRQALAQLPPFGSAGNDTACTARIVPAKNPIMRPSAHRGSLLFNGSGRPLDLDEPAKTLPASMGGNATPIVDQDELELGSEPWVRAYHARLAAGAKPIREVPARLRRITVEEAAALQTFPSDWRFHGTQMAQYRQIGNAVPPSLAYHVALAVRRSLETSADDEAPHAHTAALVSA